uniref:Delta-like protein n=1 Tax=Parastrongyloides trichosuri TaxID=131310 RepID=A0A0N4ZHL7_PARTI
MDDCATNPCAFNATCTDLVNDFQCNCPNGFTGKRCEEKVDICETNPCYHGSCVDSLFSRKCICEPGWGGEACDFNINECENNPCKNNGTCIDVINGFECQCLASYYGSVCQYRTNYCALESCQNGGICINNNDSFECDCPEGFEGKKCEIDVDECRTSKCYPQGTLKCKDGINKYECICKKGFVGKYCNEKVDECSKNPCYNNGICSINENGINCKCQRGWKGEFCQEEINMCTLLSNPCNNNGICIPLPNESYYCSCPDGVSGTNCDNLPNLCLGEPCLNGGTCISHGTYSECHCLPSFTGPGCQYKIDVCSDDFCKNDGECIKDQNDMFKCKCQFGFTGDKCEININDCLNNNCPDAAKCVDQINNYECICPFNKTGLACDKLVDVDYDLKFLNGIEIAEASMSVPVEFNGNGLSISIWVKFDHSSNGGGSILTLYDSEEKNYSKNSREILKLTDEGCFVNLFKNEKSVVLRFPHNQPINDGNWNHIVFIWNNLGTYSLIWNSIRLMQDTGYGEGKQLVGNFWIKLGSNNDDKKMFVGSITRVNLWNRIINFDTEIPLMVKDCQGAEDIFDGLVTRFTGYNKIKGKVERISKSTCGRRTLKNRENVVSLLNEPEIVVKYCPDDILISTNLRQSNVSWKEPVFETTTGAKIIRIERNLRPGQVFTRGDYMVLYVAHDENNNFVECHFNIYVSTNYCIQPEDPINGLQACESWGPNNSYKACSITCHDGYEFPLEASSFYSCSAEGLWRPNINKNIFKYPNCAKSHNANRVIMININYPNSGICNNAAKNTLAEKLYQRLQYLNTKWVICNDDSFEGDSRAINCPHLNVTVECTQKMSNRVRRNDDELQSQIFNVAIQMGVKRDSETSQNIKIIDLLKSEILLNDIFNLNQVIPNGSPDLSSFKIENIYYCGFGTVLKNDVCVPCSPGTAFNIKTNKCEYCPIGTYQSREGELSCVQCPDTTTTIGIGSVTPDECKPSCEPGHYFNTQTSICEECGVGMYQPEKGKFECYACGVGQTTLLSHSVSADDCRDECPDGEQMTIAGVCQNCPIGTYRTKGQQRQCELCPEGTTTEFTRSTHKLECNILYVKKIHKDR